MIAKGKCMLISGFSAAFGGALGNVSGSNNWAVVAVISMLFAILAVWGFDGMIKKEKKNK